VLGHQAVGRLDIRELGHVSENEQNQPNQKKNLEKPGANPTIANYSTTNM
jgi:hypothetical protein